VKRRGKARLTSAITVQFVGVLAFSLLTGLGRAEAETSKATVDPVSVNAACYVCHMAFVHEKISEVHLKAKVTCIDCHGMSAGHANDENIGATRPDITYERRQVDLMCGKCHRGHDVPAVQVVRRFVERKLTNPLVVCTDCHGTHWIEPPAQGERTGRIIPASPPEFRPARAGRARREDASVSRSLGLPPIIRH